ncbi:MAG: RdgB/HAM1 family non-canonical purine NTP pyrophosphatase [Proteobacteria bacterium]|nr:RdgB/HAM1 family non-canonical purine NTP pyrophosphatase [Pseudomonadota bacterium]
MFNELILASKNPGKIKELSALLAPMGVRVRSALEMDLPDVVEDRDTFDGNAAKKAEEIAAATGLPALADDSGICVDTLDGRPGVFSARYGGYERLLEELKAHTSDVHPAHFMCVLALAVPGQQTRLYEGRIDGHVVAAPRGTSGFGYDPVFQPKGYKETFGEMDPILKNKISHRGLALQAFVADMGKAAKTA